MAIKNYMINDKWLDIAKQNIVEVKSTDGVIGSVKVNGQEYGGGGGSSDFSTAEVTFSVTDDTRVQMPLLTSTPSDALNPLTNIVVDGTYLIALYKGTAVIQIDAEGTITPSGDIELVDDENMIYLVTGDCTITIS